MRRFFDTNILVYAYDRAEAGKREAARVLVANAMDEDEFVVSTQVLAEFHATALRTGKSWDRRRLAILSANGASITRSRKPSISCCAQFRCRSSIR